MWKNSFRIALEGFRRPVSQREPFPSMRCRGGQGKIERDRLPKMAACATDQFLDFFLRVTALLLETEVRIMNIVDPILYQCRRQPPAAAICVPGPGIGLISYRRFGKVFTQL